MGTPVVYMIYRKRNQMGIRHKEAFWPVGRPATLVLLSHNI